VSGYTQGTVAARRLANPRLTDLGLALGLTAVVVSWTAMVSPGQAGARRLDVLGFVLLAGGPLALAVRRRSPEAVMCAAGVSYLGYLALHYPLGPVPVACGVALFTLAAEGRRMAGFLALIGLAAALSALSASTSYPPPHPFLGTVAFFIAALVIGFGTHRLLRQIAEVRSWAIWAERTREEEAERRAAAERMRIARELHDVIAHNTALINIHARAAIRMAPPGNEELCSTLDLIKDASKEALRELRATVGVLRESSEDPAPLAPPPSLERIDELIDSVTSAGVTLELSRRGEPRRLSSEVEMAAYRILQEALTNVLKHAGGVNVEVTVAYGEDDVTVQVDNAAGRTVTVGPSGGNGVIGMRQRTVLLGGEFQAGPRPGGGYRVAARLPAMEAV
jgi:signal transduction histidine kinase